MAEITPSMIKELRERTQAGMLDCKKALAQSDGDMEAAAEFLRKKGLAAADKKAGREIKEGIVAVKVADDSRKASICEVNCETDFVAMNENFQKLAADVAGEIFAADLKAGDPVPESLEEKIKGAIAINKENMGIGSFDTMEVESGKGGVVTSYIHSNQKIGVLVKLSTEKADASVEILNELGKELAMQAAAANPEYLKPEDVPEDVKSKEKEIYKEQMKDSGKPDNILDKIVEGKLGKYYQEVCLLNQVYIKDSAKKIPDLIKEFSDKIGSPVSVDAFIRIQIAG
ncbi:MAG: translation elongation factor Ts [Spirochaetota bacterium]